MAEMDDRDRELIKDYIQQILDYWVEEEEFHPEVAAGLVRVHLPLIEDSFLQFFPARFCAERVMQADLRNLNKGGPGVGFLYKRNPDGTVEPEGGEGDANPRMP